MDERSLPSTSSNTSRFFDEIEEEDAMKEVLQALERGHLEERGQRLLGALEGRVASLEETVRQALQGMARVLEVRQSGVTERAEAAVARRRMDELEERLAALEVMLHGAAPTAADGQTEAMTEALTEAALDGRVEEVKSLLARGARVDGENFGRSALYFASAAGHSDVVAVLLRSGAEVNSMDMEGESPLHAAAEGGSTECIVQLLAAGALIDARDNRGRTALHMAAVKGHVSCTRALLAAGAATDVEDNIHRRPEDVAANERVGAVFRSRTAYFE